MVVEVANEAAAKTYEDTIHPETQALAAAAAGTSCTRQKMFYKGIKNECRAENKVSKNVESIID